MQEELDMLQSIYDAAVAFLVTYSFQLIGAILILLAGFVAAGWVSRAVLRLQERADVDVTLRDAEAF